MDNGRSVGRRASLGLSASVLVTIAAQALTTTPEDPSTLRRWPDSHASACT
jgi:hypothetical protein